MEIDPAAVSLMFRGMRKMTTHEAHQVATIIGVPVTEVLRQAGVDVLDDVTRVPITSYLDENGLVHLMPAKTHDVVPGPADCPIGTYAVQLRAPASTRDGWLLFVSPTQDQAADRIDQLCTVALSNGKQVIASVRRGYRSGTHNLIVWPTEKVWSDAEVVWCAPVLWIKPA